MSKADKHQNEMPHQASEQGWPPVDGPAQPGAGPWPGGTVPGEVPPHGPWGAPPPGYPPHGYPPQGPYGAPPPYGYHPGYHGAPWPGGHPGMGPAGAPGGAPAGQGVERGAGAAAGFAAALGDMADKSGLGMFKEMFSWEDGEFWKGAMVGAAVVMLLTNENLRNSLIGGAAQTAEAMRSGMAGFAAAGGAGMGAEESDAAPDSSDQEPFKEHDQ